MNNASIILIIQICGPQKRKADVISRVIPAFPINRADEATIARISFFNSRLFLLTFPCLYVKMKMEYYHLGGSYGAKKIYKKR